MELLKKKIFKKNAQLEYFEKFVKEGRSKESHLPYIFNDKSHSADYLFLKNQEENSIKGDSSKVTFITTIKNSRTCLLNHTRKEHVPGCPNSKVEEITQHNIFTGYLLKQVNGGYVIELNGFLCFMPFSLGETGKISAYQQTTKKVEFYYLNRMSITRNSRSELMYSFNIIVSRKHSRLSLKRVLKAFNTVLIKKGVFSLKKRSKINIKNKRIRLFLQSRIKKPNFFCKRIKELIFR